MRSGLLILSVTSSGSRSPHDCQANVFATAVYVETEHCSLKRSELLNPPIIQRDSLFSPRAVPQIPRNTARNTANEPDTLNVICFHAGLYKILRGSESSSFLSSLSPSRTSSLFFLFWSSVSVVLWFCIFACFRYFVSGLFCFWSLACTWYLMEDLSHCPQSESRSCSYKNGMIGRGL
jgi:hypothetical protein